MLVFFIVSKTTTKTEPVATIVTGEISAAMITEIAHKTSKMVEIRYDATMKQCFIDASYQCQGAYTYIRTWYTTLLRAIVRIKFSTGLEIFENNCA